MIVSKETKMYVQLASFFDLDRFEQMSKNEKLALFNNPEKTVFIEVKSIKEAVNLCNDYINRFNLGNSSWSGGMVVDEEFNFIANISFNGRVWDNEDWRLAKEILC